MRRHVTVFLFLIAFLSFALPARAVDINPGDSCAGFAAGSYRPTGGPENPDGALVVCDGSIWQPILRYSSVGNAVMFASTGLAAAPLHVWGEAIIGNQGLACTPEAEGAIRYTGASPPWEYCDGSAWVNFKQPRCQDDDTGECYLDVTRSNDDPDFIAVNIADGVNILGVTGSYTGSGGCNAPASCTNVGDVCSDGSIFAGFMVYNNSSCEPLYVTDDNQSTSSQWKNATGTDDISTDDHLDGKVNAAGRAGSISDFPAFDLCESNTYHGKSDWYLPARAELNLLWLNRTAIGNFTTGNYWSSTEYTTSNAWLLGFGSGGQFSNGKTSNYVIRCVRRD